MKKLTSVLMIALVVIAMLTLVACDPDSPSGTPSGVPSGSAQRVINLTVLDEGVAVEGASVSVRSSSYTATTDADGKCSLSLSSEDSSAEYYTLVVGKSGYLEKIFRVEADEFSSGSANVTISIESENITLSGVVKADGSPLEGALVAVSFDTATATTDAEGKYSIVLPRPIEGFDVTVSKQFYATATESVTEISGKTITVNADLSANSFAVQGNVAHFFRGGIEGATVKVKGTDISVLTDSEGDFSLTEIKGVALPYQLVVTNSGSQTATVSVTENNADLDIELVDDPIKLGILSPSNKSYNMSVVRDSKGIWFYFESAQQFVTGDKLCIYIDVNETGTAVLGSSVIEFALRGDQDVEGNPIALVWNLKAGHSVTEDAAAKDDEILWGEEVIYNLDNNDNGSYIEAFISYATFAKAGTDFAIDKNSVVGISFFDRSSGAHDASGWDSADFPGVDGNNWVHPDFPGDYVRLAPENVVYEASDNNYVPYTDYEIIVNVEDEEGNALPSTIKMVYPYDVVVNSATGEETFTLGGKYFNKEPRFTVIADGYSLTSRTVLRTEFVDGVASVTIQMTGAPVALEGSGKVVNLSGGLSGVTVSVEGKAGSVTTDATGNFDISTLEIDATGISSYTLLFSKTGYDSKSVEVTVGEAIPDVYLQCEERNLGSFGRYGWNVTIDRNESKLIVDLASPRNWYGQQDLTGAATATNNEIQIYFIKDLTATTKTADNVRELTIVECLHAGMASDWAGWRDGALTFLDWPGIAFSVVNDASGCRVHAEFAYSLLGIDKDDTIGLAFGEWYGAAGEAYPWTAPSYDGVAQKFVESGWVVNVNEPFTCLHWAADNNTKVENVA